MLNEADQIKARNLIAIRRASRKAGGKGQRLRRPPRIPWPAGIERSYRKSLTIILSKIRAEVASRLLPALPGIVDLAKAQRPTADARLDAYSDEVARLMSLIRSRIVGEYGEADLTDLTKRIAQAVADDNKRGIGRVFKDVLGVDLFAAEPWLNGETKAFVQNNVALIKTIPDGYLSKVEELVYAGARGGSSWQEIAATIRDDPFRSSKFRAERIARDQIGKFNGQLTELRQTQAGVSQYIWRTSRDARVRDEHAAREGQTFDWSDPPDDGHPGEAIQCRCYAEPILDDLAATQEEE